MPGVIQSAKPCLELFPLYRVFKTPGLRTPAARERIYNISVNGSPLADTKEIFLTVPVGGGEVSVSDGSQTTVCCLALLSLVCHPLFSPTVLLVVWILSSTLTQHSEPSFLSEVRGPDWEDPCPALGSICSSANICAPVL